jgi:cytoskeletal protein CcmA (bactofilin family)
MFGKGEKEAESGPAQPARGFGKSDKDTPARGAGKASGEASAISADLKVVGNLESAGDIRVDGTVVGDINSRSLTVGEGAHVEGSITAEKVRICGKLTGQVTAASVSIAATAVMNGDVTYQMLSIEEGASLEGRCRKVDATGASSTAPKVAEVKPSASVAAASGSGGSGASVSSSSGGSGGGAAASGAKPAAE